MKKELLRHDWVSYTEAVCVNSGSPVDELRGRAALCPPLYGWLPGVTLAPARVVQKHAGIRRVTASPKRVFTNSSG